MVKIAQEGCKDTPTIVFDSLKGTGFMGGSSLPENVLDIYLPVLEWFDVYSLSPQPQSRFDFFFEYLNTASSQMIMRIFKKIKTLHENNSGLTVNWFYQKGDYDMRDFGSELAEMAEIDVKVLDSEKFMLSGTML